MTETAFAEMSEVRRFSRNWRRFEASLAQVGTASLTGTLNRPFLQTMGSSGLLITAIEPEGVSPWSMPFLESRAQRPSWHIGSNALLSTRLSETHRAPGNQFIWRVIHETSMNPLAESAFATLTSLSETPSSTKELPEPARQIAQAFAREIHQIPGVVALYGRYVEDGTLHLWTAVEKDDKGLRTRVYEQEVALYEAFPDARLDFYVVTLQLTSSVSLENILPKGFLRIPLRREPGPDATRSTVPSTSTA